MKPRGRWTEVEIAMGRDGDFESFDVVPALVFGAWAVRRGIVGYTITHAPTGYRLGSVVHDEEVLEIVGDLLNLGDYPAQADDPNDETLRSMVKPIWQQYHQQGVLA